MTSNQLLTTIAITMALAGTAASASSDGRLRPLDGQESRSTPVLVAVPNNSLPHQASYGWQYFSDPRAAHAVVISPAGEYFVSVGDGPRQITGPAGQVLVARSAGH